MQGANLTLMKGTSAMTRLTQMQRWWMEWKVNRLDKSILLQLPPTCFKWKGWPSMGWRFTLVTNSAFIRVCQDCFCLYTWCENVGHMSFESQKFAHTACYWSQKFMVPTIHYQLEMWRAANVAWTNCERWNVAG